MTRIHDTAAAGDSSAAERQTRATAFDRVAAEYERARPSYPDAAVEWLADCLGIGPGRDVLDLGAGTGKLTRQLVALGARVVAVEPLAAMRAELERVVPEAVTLAGTAEAIPLDGDSVDAITSGQAFHWFDAGRALREMDRVLRPGGGVGLIWNLRDLSDALQAELSEIIGEEKETGFAEWLLAELAGPGLFGTVEQRSFRHEQLLTRDVVVDRFASTSDVAARPDAERREVLERVRAAVADLEEPIRLPYLTEAFVVSRRA